MTPRTKIIFETRLRLPGDDSAGAGTITGEQLCRTMDKAYDSGRSHGWNAAMRALREAADNLTETQVGGNKAAFDAALEAAIGRAALRAPGEQRG
jgi:hypothetical protein